MYNNAIATPRLDLAGPIRQSDASMLRGFIAHLLLLPFMVDHRAGNIPTVLDTDDQIFDIKHAPKTPYQRVQATLGNATYACEEAGVEEPISAEDFNVLGVDRAEELAAQRVAGIVLRAREAAVASALTGATGEALFTGQVTSPAENWGEATGSPLADVEAADNALGLRVGEGKRVLVMNPNVLADLRLNEELRTNFRRVVGVNDPSAVNRKIKLEVLAELLGVDEILLASARKNTANKGQTASYSWIWPDGYVLLARVPENTKDLTEPALGRMMVWSGADQSINAGAAEIENDVLRALSIETYRDESVKADIVRGYEYTQGKVLAPRCGQLIKLPADD